MKASTVVKIVLFLLMLIAAHVLFGVACSKVQSQYDAFAVERLFPIAESHRCDA